MNFQPATDRDLLIAQYTLGLLDPQETAEAHALLSQDQSAVAVALQWEQRFLSLVDQLAPVAPERELLRRVQVSLHMDVTAPPLARPAVPAPLFARLLRSTWNGIWFWRALSVIAIGLALAHIAAPAPPLASIAPLAPVAQLTQLAILQAPGQTSTPGWVLILDKEHNLVLTPRVQVDLPPDASMQLWTRSSSAPQSRSLGLLDPGHTATISKAALGDISLDQLFEMTLEPRGGSASGSPTGPILFIGRMLVVNQPAL